MADISDIKTEMQTIAEAQTGISTFVLGKQSDINVNRSSAKPIFILTKQPSVTYPAHEKKFKTYPVTFGIYDTYDITEQGSKSYDEKQKDLENLVDQFIKEFKKRSHGQTTEITTPQEWWIQEEIVANFIEVIGNDGLIGIEVTAVVTTFNDCDEGTFSY